MESFEAEHPGGQNWKNDWECGNLTYDFFSFYACQSQPLQISRVQERVLFYNASDLRHINATEKLEKKYLITQTREAIGTSVRVSWKKKDSHNYLAKANNLDG